MQTNLIARRVHGEISKISHVEMACVHEHYGVSVDPNIPTGKYVPRLVDAYEVTKLLIWSKHHILNATTTYNFRQAIL